MDPTPGASMVLEWMRPETKVAPGQSIVLYELSDIQVIGGGRAVSSR
jgi:tRNA U34 2-thiouridine synthase MnmA/TrmU